MDSFAQRKYIIGALILLMLLTFVIRLFYLQIINEEYKISAENNSRRYVVQYPSRGLVYDRNGKLLVENQAAYDIMVIPRQIKDLDTFALCQLMDVDIEYARKFFRREKNSYKPVVFIPQLSLEKFAAIQDHLFKFPDFYPQTRSLRKYPFPNAAHVLGYIGEVDSSIISKNPYYKMGDYIGISGIEKSYEDELRGRKGVKIFLVDVHNRIKENFENGKYDTAAIVGNDITTTLDIELQKYGELLMANKRGGIVAIEPSTGEILALVSSPSYDPNLLVGRARSKNYPVLNADIEMKPLFNRAIMSSQTPPGSTFKLVNALVGLQEGVITRESRFSCSAGYIIGSFKVGCHAHASPLDLENSIGNSCNAYYCNVFRKIVDNRKYKSVRKGYEVWRRHVNSFGLGTVIDTDLPMSKSYSGTIGNPDRWDKIHGKGKWKSLSIISLAIGQGEVGASPFQLANLVSAIANRGYFYIPHIVKKIAGNRKVDKKYLKKVFTTVESRHFEPVINGMELAVYGPGGTAHIAQIEGIRVCGKTGTAQNPHGENHSLFVAFAPKENPKIAIAVLVENGGYGGTWAAPIASLMMEKYLKDSISGPLRKDLEKRMIEGDLIHKNNEAQH
ncbi:MAG: penicillin-binding protein 2 [Bacteroidetes bacterium GWF2_38_335]|nr:MAG: penicillin-binding protein 2 [Bacteroidetes bacterium GWF2_38_335]OFY77432.1 MAG: penicillin-binding protein 2 [Bacteroidetes bacterium RIFOXYA12_FULL_38_20]HBS87279.1 penicillin-binding protein 2 [Bacteroidales bacterium]